jgi:hypothetical protein
MRQHTSPLTLDGAANACAEANGSKKKDGVNRWNGSDQKRVKLKSTELPEF